MIKILLIGIPALAAACFAFAAAEEWGARKVARMRGQYYSANWCAARAIVWTQASIVCASFAVVQVVSN